MGNLIAYFDNEIDELVPDDLTILIFRGHN